MKNINKNNNSENKKILIDFMEKYNSVKNGRSELWKYLDEIRELLENDYMIKHICHYLRFYRNVKLKEKTIYDFIYRNRDKILKTQTTQPVKVKEEKPKQQSKPSTPQPKPATTKTTKESEQKIKPTQPDRKKEFKRYLYHWDRQPENYLQYTEDKLNEKDFNVVMNRLIEEKLITDFEFIENAFKEPYQPEHICGYLRTCRDKLKNKKDFKAFTPAMFKYYVEDNFFAKPPPEQL